MNRLLDQWKDTQYFSLWRHYVNVTGLYCGPYDLEHLFNTHLPYNTWRLKLHATVLCRFITWWCGPSPQGCPTPGPHTGPVWGPHSRKWASPRNFILPPIAHVTAWAPSPTSPSYPTSCDTCPWCQNSWGLPLYQIKRLLRWELYWGPEVTVPNTIYSYMFSPKIIQHSELY